MAVCCSIPDRVRIWLAAGIVVCAVGCEGSPARSKPWRHAPKPGAAEGVTKSAVLVEEADRVEARRQRKHTLRIHLDADPGRLHPISSPTVWARRIAVDTIFETLIRYRPPTSSEGPGTYEPGLAKSWKVLQGGREIRFELQPNVRWHDGRRFASIDVQFTLDAIRHPRTDASQYRSMLGAITSVELIGPRALRIRTAVPSGHILRALAEIPILPSETYDLRLRAPRTTVIGSGPYKLHRNDETGVELVVNDDYWGTKPAIPRIVFVRDNDAANALRAAKADELDIIPAMIADHYPEQAEAPALSQNFRPLRLSPPSYRYLALNSGDEPFDDPRVREAASLLVDRKELVERVYDGLARAVGGPIWPGGPGSGKQMPTPKYDPDRAATLLDAAGWRDADGDGVRERGGRRLMITVLTTDRDNRERNLVLKDFRSAGFVLDTRVGSSAVLLNRLRDGQFDMAFVSWNGDVDRPMETFVGTGGRVNFGRTSDPRIDGILARIERAQTPAERWPLVSGLGARLSELHTSAPLVVEHPYGLIHRRVRGVRVWNGWLALRELTLAPDSPPE